MEDKYFQTDTEINARALGRVTCGKYYKVKMSLTCVRFVTFLFFSILEITRRSKGRETLYFIFHYFTQNNVLSLAFVPFDVT